MASAFTSLVGQERILMQTELKPAQGQRFQPTGFADLGAAVYQLPDATRMLLVESPQSLANRLEQTIIGPDNELVKEFAGLPYIRAKLTGDTETYTNSLIEAHRINSPFIISNEQFKQNFMKAAEYQKAKPLNWKKIARALLKYDINSLLHGVFLANLEDGRVKVARALSAFIEASDVAEVVSGGVKNNPIDPTGTLRAVAYDKDVYGNVPYQKVEYTAGQIVCYFNLDLGLLRSYDLGEEATDLLIALALYKIQAFLDTGLRLRTACDFICHGNLACTSPESFLVPNKEDLTTVIKSGILACQRQGLFADPPVTELVTPVKIKLKKGTEASTPEDIESSTAEDDDNK
jgi:CRISPR-associated protein Csb1